MPHISECLMKRSLKPTDLRDMTLGQLQVIVNDLHSQIESEFRATTHTHTHTQILACRVRWWRGHKAVIVACQQQQVTAAMLLGRVHMHADATPHRAVTGAAGNTGATGNRLWRCLSSDSDTILGANAESWVPETLAAHFPSGSFYL